MTTLESTLCEKNMSFFSTSPISSKWLKPSITPLCAISDPIMVESISRRSFALSLTKVVYSSNSLVLTPLSRMMWRNEKNLHIMSMVWCLLRGMGVLKHFRRMVVLTATYLINRTPSRVLQGKALLHILQPASILFPYLPSCLRVHLFRSKPQSQSDQTWW